MNIIISYITNQLVGRHFKLTFLPIKVPSQVQKQPVNGKNKHYHLPVHLLHQEEGADPLGEGGVRISSMVSFSFGCEQ